MNNKNEYKFYIKINLSFFDGEKTEKPTPKKKKKARDEGQVALSKEVQSAISFIASFYALKYSSGYLYKKSMENMYFDLNLIRDIDNIFNATYMHELIMFSFLRIMIICLPMFAICMFVNILSTLLQVGWNPTSKPLKPKLSHFNPVKGLKKIISMNSLVELIKSILKLLVIGMGMYFCLKGEVKQIQNLLLMDLFPGLIYIGNVCVNLGIKVGYYFIIVAILDFAYTKYQHNKKLKMSKQDIKDEHKQSEGDPHLKAKIRRKMMESSMRRMMQEVPQADVVITNPTHYAVALKYDRAKGAAPIVVAKGVDHLARRIKEIAGENSVEMVENRPLARALYNTVDVGHEIPPELYQAVAEVLAFVFRLKNV